MQKSFRDHSITNDRRVLYLDCLRALACLMVVMIHSSAGYVASESPGSFNFWIGNILEALSRAGVPLFVMISGALMLDERYSLTKKKLLDHVKRLLFFFAFWSVFYCTVFKVAIPMLNHESIKITDVLYALVGGHFHLWFILMMIALYAILPLLRLWVKKENKRYVEYFLILSLVFAYIIPHLISVLVCVDPRFDLLNQIVEKFHFHYAVGFSAYFILGWYLNTFPVRPMKVIVTAGICGLFVTIFGTYAIRTLTSSTELVFFKNFSPYLLLYAVSVFSLAKNVVRDDLISPVLIKLIKCISKYSLGIYAIHAAILSAFGDLLANVTAVIAIPIYFFACVTLSLSLSAVLKKIPYLKNVV